MTDDFLTIELKTKLVRLKIGEFDTDIDTDELTQIHFHNIMGEILTSSVLLNRVGNLQAEMENILSEAKLDFEIFEAQIQQEKRKALTFSTEANKKGETKMVKPTIDEVSNAVMTDARYRIKKQHLLTLEKNLRYINSLYWSCKSKDDKLNNLSQKLRPEEFEKDLLEEKINGVHITIHKKTIPN